MPSLLTRSKSLRFLKGDRRGAQQEETQTQNSEPQPNFSQTDFDRFKSATPLPSPGRTLEAPEMVVRPSTSGGPGERVIQFHKKTVPAPSIYSEDRFLAFSSPTNSTAVLHAVESPEVVIGVALGSPTVGSHWNLTPQATTENLVADAHMSPYNYGNASTTTVTGPQPQSKPKISRWKSLFKKTAPPPKEKPSFYQLAQQAAPARADSHHDTSPKAKPKAKSNQVTSPPAYNPEIRSSRNKSAEAVSSQVQHGRKRSATVGADRVRPRYMVQRSITTPNPLPQDGQVPQMKFMEDPPTQATQTAPGAGLLGVDIPDITMDRYSVMFSGVLEPALTRSSLYLRRQEKADKSKPLDKIDIKDENEDLPEPKLQQRDTSPTISNPPSARLSLFPATGRATPTLRTGTPILRAPSPLVSNTPRSRSKTAPAASPTQQTFKTTEESKPINPLSTSVTRQHSEPHSLKPQQLPLTPTSIRSFESDKESITIVVARTEPAQKQAWKAYVESQEPSWEILPRPTYSKRDTPLNRTVSRKQPRVTAASALSSHPATSPIEVSSPLQNLQMLLSPTRSAESVQLPVIQRKNSERKAKVVGTAATATVGIARSVSVSRASRPRTLVRTATTLEKNPERRFGEGMALTPTLVEIGNRKSERVQLVDA